MEWIARVLVGLVALIHLYIVVLEMVLWTRPRTRAAFGMSEAVAESTKVLAANQGLYNGFLAAGLIWSMFHPDPAMAFQLRLFFLGAVIVAGVYGAVTVNRRIFFVQALPAVIAFVAVLIAG